MTDVSENAFAVEPEPSVAAAAADSPDDGELIRSYFRRVAPEDQPRNPVDIVTIVSTHRQTAEHRPPGEVCLHTYSPPGGADGWGGSTTAIDIVNDDMPFLVDSVISELGAAGVTVYRVLHPILAVRRDADGTLREVVGDAHAGMARSGITIESWMHVVVDRMSDADHIDELEDRLRDALGTVRRVVSDTAAMTAQARQAAAELRAPTGRSVSGDPAGSDSDAGECADLLDWFAGGSVLFLGHRHTENAGPSGGLGLLRTGGPVAESAADAVPDRTGGVLSVGQQWLDVAIGRDAPVLTVDVAVTGAFGSSAEHRFLVALTPQARTADVTGIPVLRRKVARVLDHLGASRNSYSGQRAMDVLATYPRAELFWVDDEQLVEVAAGQLQLASRRRLRAFLQQDPAGHFISVLVFLPRDRYTTARRLAMQQVLLDALGGSSIRYTARIGDSLLASVHFTVMTDGRGPMEPDLADLTRRLRDSVRSWEDRLVAAVVGGDDDLGAAEAISRYADAFDEAYKEDYQVADAVDDLARLDALTDEDDLALSVNAPPRDAPGDSRLKLYTAGSAISLSRAMPVLQSFGISVIDERPYEVRRTDGTASHIYDFGVVAAGRGADGNGAVDLGHARFADAFTAAWRGAAEVDRFNELVMSAGLAWRDVAVLRGYAKYLRQIRSPYTQSYIEQVLCSYPTIAAHLTALFAERFDPDRDDAGREERCTQRVDAITAELDDVTSLDADRIMRRYMQLIGATVRTNAYRSDDAGRLRGALAFKLDPRRLSGIPKPVPAHEVWVYSPRVEGVHLRFGAVARGGLRWSDRPEDFRTEVLGLVKAQEVKNAVIVPVGAKGGFVVKRPPEATGDAQIDRPALQAEGVECYRTYISCLLDVTDNRAGTDIIAPPQVVRHDADDPYLVVAADKGTARFSDIANGVAADYDYWLGDAFASGGSAGYDHKDMGITARGAWESVKHHFRELGIDVANDDFSCVGIGDMSGDVFGNGLLRSPHTRLIAAFDHRHIFVDPDPDAGATFVERQRLYDLPRSSWADYDRSLISPGGGVWPRSAKSITVSEPMRRALGLPDQATKLAPNELIKAILLAPADLLWNGGIGTYVKASTETDAQVGDKTNDPVRVSGNELRVKVVGEGGNLGVTQLGRIEYARAGGRINTDAMDNSAGVDTSDHEVNIKVGLQRPMADGDLTEQDRNQLLAEMTDDVAELVLADNTAQNRLLGVSRQHAVPMLSVHARQIRGLVAAGRLDRALEFLPTRSEIEARIAGGEGLTSPELSVLIAYTKAKLSAEMLASDLPSDPAFADTLGDYFPRAMRERFADAVANHPLAREIVTTMAANQVVNKAGITYAFRLGEEIAASATDAIRAFWVVSHVFDLPALTGAIDAADHQVPAECQDNLTLLTRRLLDRASRWFLSRRPQPLAVRDEIERYRAPAQVVIDAVGDLLVGVEHDNVARDIDELVAAGATRDLATRVGYSLYTYSALDIADVAEESGRDLLEVATLYYALSAHMGFDEMLTSVTNLARGDRWHALARQALRDDFYGSLRMITADVLSTTDVGTTAASKIEQWEEENASRLARARTTLSEIASVGASDLAALSVAAREVRTTIR